jgi:hypothetical protein
MELYNVNNTIYTFRVTGNTRLKLIQEFYINKNSTNECTNLRINSSQDMYIMVTNTQNFAIPYDKCYLTLSYDIISKINSGKKYPDISCVYKPPDYIPLYVSQPDTSDKNSIHMGLKYFDIKPQTKLYNALISDVSDYEPYDETYDEPYDFLTRKNSKINYPTIAFDNGEIIHLIKKEKLIEIDTDEENYFTDISVSDE